jgi:glutamate-1-semialdehyde 2,1-aminomutase
MTFEQSKKLQKRFHKAIPGGGHTYAKGDDQYPESMPPIIIRGKGCHVWDVDGNEFIEFGAGLRAVGLGHAYKPVIEAASRQMLLGSNFVRPATIELECAENFLEMISRAEMVKFGKNGSDATSAAVKLARGFTGRDLIAICAEHPFFSVDDWFIGSTQMPGGIPQTIRDLTVKFHFNDLPSLCALFDKHPGQIACVIMEAEKDTPPADKFLQEVKETCHKNGAVFILDEMITGFRWHNGGAQAYFDVVPDLCAFGKALANGFCLSALAGQRDIMKLGGLEHDKERVFLMSYTHGAESHALAAAIATMKIYQQEPVVETLWKQGERLAAGFRKAIAENHLEGHVDVIGRPCNLVYATRDENKRPSQPFRTLFLQETIKRGMLAPSLVVNYSHSDADIDRAVEIIGEVLPIYRKALDEGIEKYLVGRPVKPVFRKFN